MPVIIRVISTTILIPTDCASEHAAGDSGQPAPAGAAHDYAGGIQAHTHIYTLTHVHAFIGARSRGLAPGRINGTRFPLPLSHFSSFLSFSLHFFPHGHSHPQISTVTVARTHIYTYTQTHAAGLLYSASSLLCLLLVPKDQRGKDFGTVVRIVTRQAQRQLFALHTPSNNRSQLHSLLTATITALPHARVGCREVPRRPRSSLRCRTRKPWRKQSLR